MTHKKKYLSCVFHDSLNWDNISESQELLEYSITKNELSIETQSFNGSLWSTSNPLQKFSVELFFQIQNSSITSTISKLVEKRSAFCAAVKEDHSIFGTALFHDCVVIGYELRSSNAEANADLIILKIICSDIDHF